jgi:hypothetical protein
MSKIFSLVPLLIVAHTVLAQESNLIGVGIRPEQAKALSDTFVEAAGNSAVTGTLSVSGAVTTTSGVRYPAALMESVAAAGAGSASTDAGALTTGKYIHLVTASDETKGVKLPACATANIGEVHFLLNAVANKFLRVWPNTGGAINGGSADAKIDTGATTQGGKTTVCACQAANVWYCG